MAEEIKTLINQTQGYELKVPCSKCSGKTTHRVLVSADVEGSLEQGIHSFEWRDHYQVLQCLGCETLSFRKESTNSEEFVLVDEHRDEWQNVVYEDLYPPRVEGRKGIVEQLYYLPGNVQQIYRETLQALTADSPVLAGIGLRALVETICKEKGAEGKDLFNKIDDLVEKRVITPAGAKILHQLRTLGNQAAHEVKPHDDKQLGVAMDVIEHVIKDVYIIPKQVSSVFSDET